VGSGAPSGFYASGSSDALLAIVLVMMLFDGVSWATQRIRQAMRGVPDATPETLPPTEAQPAAPLRSGSWVFSRP
jgi:hypothetical protein